VSEPPKANKEKKEGRTKARTQQTQEQGQEEAKEEEEPGQQQEEAGGTNRQSERMRTGQLLAPDGRSRKQRLETSRQY
jgi:hypothetical protein